MTGQFQDSLMNRFKRTYLTSSNFHRNVLGHIKCFTLILYQFNASLINTIITLFLMKTSGNMER